MQNVDHSTSIDKKDSSKLCKIFKFNLSDIFIYIGILLFILNLVTLFKVYNLFDYSLIYKYIATSRLLGYMYVLSVNTSLIIGVLMLIFIEEHIDTWMTLIISTVIYCWTAGFFIFILTIVFMTVH